MESGTFPRRSCGDAFGITMPKPTPGMVQRIVRAHLGLDVEDSRAADLVDSFLTRIESGESLAVDQLLNAVFLLSGNDAPQGKQRDESSHSCYAS